MIPLDDLLALLKTENGSDLHLLSGDPPRIRQYGELRTIGGERLEVEETTRNLHQIMTPRMRQIFNQEDNADFAYDKENLGRFRVNVFRHLNGIGAVFRLIPTSAHTMAQLGLPSILHTLSMYKQGMILVTGKTGSGKSTTLAAILDHINRTKKGHVLTIEDPIEFEHTRINCLISQREVGQHTSSFANALKSALREDPDVILVGEMRDLETISLAVTAAETGILVLGTLHTNSAALTVDRIINTFPAQKQPHIRSMLSTSLRGVVSQQLLRRKDGLGRIAAIEILINTPAVANTIREGKTDQIESILQGGSLMGMQSMDAAIRNLLSRQTIDAQTAYEAANEKSQFMQFLKNT